MSKDCQEYENDQTLLGKRLEISIEQWYQRNKEEGSQTDLRSKAAIITEIGKFKRSYYLKFSQKLFWKKINCLSSLSWEK